ncbi:MAG: hypothetical protein V9E81_16690 [Marmoricola sp.]
MSSAISITSPSSQQVSQVRSSVRRCGAIPGEVVVDLRQQRSAKKRSSGKVILMLRASVGTALMLT